MQPLYSVDHETRQNSCRREDEVETMEPASNEDTPLLQRFPLNHRTENNPATTIIVTSLLIILALGVVIGIYLLIIQNNSENILPPVETALQLVSRAQWDPVAISQLRMAMTPMQASQVIVVQTDSEECHSTATCSRLLQKLQANMTLRFKQLPYNFMVSTNGQTYESLGWHEPSPLFPQYAGTMVLAFIGNFTEFTPSLEQLEEAGNFFDESVSQQHLSPNFDIIGKNTTFKPQFLFECLQSLPQWNSEWSDA